GDSCCSLGVPSKRATRGKNPQPSRNMWAFHSGPGCPKAGLLISSGEEMGMCRCALRFTHHWSERAKAHRTRQMLDGDIRFAAPDPQPTACSPTDRQVAIELKCPIDDDRGLVEFVHNQSEGKSRPCEGQRIIFSQVHGSPRKPRGLRGLLCSLGDPPEPLAASIAPRCHAVGCCKSCIEINCALQKS